MTLWRCIEPPQKGEMKITASFHIRKQHAAECVIFTTPAVVHCRVTTYFGQRAMTYLLHCLLMTVKSRQITVPAPYRPVVHHHTNIRLKGRIVNGMNQDNFGPFLDFSQTIIELFNPIYMRS